MVTGSDRETQARRRDGGLDWLIDDFVDRIPGASRATVVTTDGLVLAFSAEISGDAADQLAAITSGLASLSEGAARCFGAGDVRQIIVEMDDSYLFVSRIGDGSALAVLCDPSCDIGLIGYEMSLLIVRIGDALTPDLRAELSPPVDLRAWPPR